MPVDINVNCDFSDCIYYEKCINGDLDQHTKFLIYTNVIDSNQYFMPKMIIKNNSWVACESHVEKEIITHKELASMIDGNQYKKETTRRIVKFAKENNLVIAYCVSDDVMILEGAISDEIDAMDGTTHKRGNIEIKAEWYPKDRDDLAWLISTNKEHSKFTIYRQDEKFCEGIVFSLEGVK